MNTETEKDINAINVAIDAMEKIVKISAYCKGKQIVQYDTEYSEGYVNGANMATADILKILEEKQHE